MRGAHKKKCIFRYYRAVVFMVYFIGKTGWHDSFQSVFRVTLRGY